MTLRQFTCFLLAAFCVTFSFAQQAGQQDLRKNFQPLKSSGKLPAVFTQNTRDVIKQDISGLKQKKDKDRRLKSTFVTASNYQIERLLRSGDVLVNDEITKFMNSLADELLKDNGKLRSQLHIFTLKSDVVNAYSYDKGFIFINVGLIAQLESEAQLAYILCHEISHFTKQHNISRFIVNEEIDRKQYEGGNEEKFIEKCQYSKEHESEADLEGFNMFERSRYNLTQAEKVIEVLQYSHLPFELVEFKKSYFETPNYVLPDRYFLKEVSPIRDNSDEDDSKQTHPNTKKRRDAITSIAASRDNSKRVNSILGQQRFEYIRNLARMELCRLYLKHRDYPNSFYASYILAKQFPENPYVHEMLSKSLLGLALYANGEVKYSENSDMDEGIVSYNKIESFPQQIYHLVEKMPANEWAVLALNHVYRTHKKFPKNKAIAAVTDTLFNLIGRTPWGVTEFARVIKKDEGIPVQTKTVVDTLNKTKSKTDLIKTLQKESNTKIEDTIYFKNAFADLFATDPEFARKFPTSSSNTQLSDGTFKSYRNISNTRISSNIKLRRGHSVDTILLMEPFYLKIDEREKQSVEYIASDEKQESYVQKIDECAARLNIRLIKLDPGLMSADEVDKMNDFSVLNDWFDERFDSESETKAILNTNEISSVISKYGTHFVLKTGVASVINMSGKTQTFFFGFLFDLKSNKMVYRKYEIFKIKDRRDFLGAKTYQMLFDLKHPAKPLD